MEDLGKLVLGALLIIIGAFLVYFSILLRLIDAILILGILLLFVGVALLVVYLVLNKLGYQISVSKEVAELVDATSNDLKNQQIASTIKESVLGSNGISSTRSPDTQVLRAYGGRNEDSVSFFGPTKEKNNRNDKRNDIKNRSKLHDMNRSVNKSGSWSNALNRNSSSKSSGSKQSVLTGFKSYSNINNNPKAVLRTPKNYVPPEGDMDNYSEEPPLKESSYHDEDRRVLVVLDDYDENKRVPALRDLKFTPNYDKPMRVTRRPRKKAEDTIDLDNIPKRTIEGSKLIFDDNSYLELEKEPNFPKPKEVKTFEDIAEEVIVPIHIEDMNTMAYEGINSNNVNVTYAGYDNESQVLEYDYSNSIQEPVHIVEVSNIDEIPKTNVGTDVDYVEPIHVERDVPYDSEFVIDDDLGADVERDVPYDSEFVIDNLEEDIGVNNPPLVAKPIESNNVPDVLLKPTLDDFTEDQSIKFDPNNPESLPIPKLLNSYVICEKGILTSKDAFEEVATHARSEILLEAPDIRDMGEVFLSALSKVNSRIIIEEFDKTDLSYVLLISSLLESGIKIKTVPHLESFNLIGDLSHALIISNDDSEDMEYGAVYDDEDSVRDIKNLFEASWNVANDLKI